MNEEQPEVASSPVRLTRSELEKLRKQELEQEKQIKLEKEQKK